MNINSQYLYNGSWLIKEEIIPKLKPIGKLGTYTILGHCYRNYDIIILKNGNGIHFVRDRDVIQFVDNGKKITLKKLDLTWQVNIIKV